MQKKVEHKVTSKKLWTLKQTLKMKKWGKWFINYYYLPVKVKKNNGTYTVLMLNYLSGKAYEA